MTPRNASTSSKSAPTRFRRSPGIKGRSPGRPICSRSTRDRGRARRTGTRLRRRRRRSAQADPNAPRPPPSRSNRKIAGIQAETVEVVGVMNSAPAASPLASRPPSRRRYAAPDQDGAQSTLDRVRRVAESTREQSVASDSIAQRSKRSPRWSNDHGGDALDGADGRRPGTHLRRTQRAGQPLSAADHTTGCGRAIAQPPSTSWPGRVAQTGDDAVATQAFGERLRFSPAGRRNARPSTG